MTFSMDDNIDVVNLYSVLCVYDVIAVKMFFKV